ncbi:MAG: dTMP kinase [Dehalococcoidia bacterium]
MSGLLISLEGGEGCGKSTQAGELARRLRELGRPTTLTREPGGTALGERLRQVLLDPGAPLDARSEFLLFAAARAQITTEVIKPALERGEIVVCDRFGDSSLAYQGYGRGLKVEEIRAINQVATQGLRPDLTVLLDLAPEAGRARQGGQGSSDRFGQEDLSFHRRVRRGYIALAGAEPERWLVVDGGQPQEEVAEAVWTRVRQFLR